MTKEDGMSTLPRRQLGRQLRRLRMEAGITVDAAAAALQRSAPTIWRQESGRAPLRVADVLACCRLYGADERTTEELAELAQETHTVGTMWWMSYAGAVPKRLAMLLSLEQEASRIREYDAELAIGLLQTAAYAGAAVDLARPRLSDVEIEKSVAVRLERQKILTRRTPAPPALDVILGEAALLRAPGSGVMAAQLRHLVERTRLRNISVRVLPLSAGLHPAQVAGRCFTILDFPRPRVGPPEPPVVYTPTLTAGYFLEEAGDVQAYDQVWSELDKLALGEDDSMAMISNVAGRYER